jgi:hypothetical protein
MHGSITDCVVGLLCVAVFTSCSALIHTNERQCKRDADCVSAELGTICVDQVCIMDDKCVGSACTVSNASGSEGSCASDRQCTVETAPRCLNKTCVSDAIASRWMCTADDQTIRSVNVRYGFHIVDFLSREPPNNIIVRACRNGDVACAEPVASFTDTDKTGHAQFDLPSGFFGFFEVVSDSLPTLLYVTKPIIKNTLNRDLPMLTADTLQLLSGAVGYPFDPSKGIALLEALDCSDTPAGGIQFGIVGSSADRFYVVDQVPSRDATLSAYDETNNTANGGFLNVAPGFVTFNARLGANGLELGSFNARIRANTITFIDMHF